MNLSQSEINVLQELGTKYMGVSTLSIQKEKIELWKSLNRSKMQRPMVVIDQLPENELNINEELNCQIKDPFWRNIEYKLRLNLYKWNHFPVDMVLEPYISIPQSITNSGYGLKPLDTSLKSDNNSNVASHFYENQITTLDDIEKIKDMVITHDEKLSKKHIEEATFIFNGIAPVKYDHGIQFHLGVWDFLSSCMGVENIYYYLMDKPKLLHAAMTKMTNSVLAGIKQANELQIVNDTINTCHCSYIYTDELLPDCGAGKGAKSQNSWAFGLAQLFTSISPSLFGEFEIPYISKMAEQFGMIYYGCCDKLDDRLDLVKKIPNVKKVSCSPWSNKKNFAENIGNNLIMSNKPSPAYLAVDSIDYAIIRKDLEETVSFAKDNNVNLEFILKDISTVQYQPERLENWANIAMEVVCK